ncbi:MAG: hypothetical protein Q9169_008164 [Polycauliona sp. 2 TL-2023]
MIRPTAFLLALFLLLLCAATSASDTALNPDGLKPPPKLQPQPFNITTLAGNAKNESVIECWSVANLAVSSTPGINGALLASLAAPNALSFVNIPGKFDGGLHNAPAVHGKAVITLPKSPDKATVFGGANGLILAADVAAVSKLGHTTVYPSKEETTVVVMPIKGNTVPKHTVLHKGACTAKEQNISK